MSKKSFNSVLAAEMRDFVALRKTEGKDYGSQTWNLVYFDRFLCGIDWQHQWILQPYLQAAGVKSPAVRSASVGRAVCAGLTRRCGRPSPRPSRSLTPPRKRFRLPHKHRKWHVRMILMKKARA